MYSASCTSPLLFGDGGHGGLEGGKGTGRGFWLEMRPVFHWPPAQIPTEEQDDRRRSMGRGTGTKPFLGGSDPTLSGLAAAQRLRRRGSLPPKLFSKVLAPSPAELQSDQPAEMKVRRKRRMKMALIPKVEPKLEKKVVSARLDEEAHTMLQRYAAFLGGATHEYIIGESLKRLFRRDKEFNEWLAKNDGNAAAPLTTKSATRPASSAL